MRYNFQLTSTNPEVLERKGTNPFTRKPTVFRSPVGMSKAEQEAVSETLQSMGTVPHNRETGEDAHLIATKDGASISVFITHHNGSVEFDEYQYEVAEMLHRIASAGNLAIHPSALPEIVAVTKVYPEGYLKVRSIVHETSQSLHEWLTSSDWPWAENPPI